MNRINNMHIPTREEFHRDYAGEISSEDFCTEKSGRRKVPYLTITERKLKSKSKKLR